MFLANMSKRKKITFFIFCGVALVAVGFSIWAALSIFAEVVGQIESTAQMTIAGEPLPYLSSTKVDINLNPPAPPSNLTATVSGTTAVNLAWVDNSTNELGFKIERSTGGCTSFSVIKTTASNAKTYTDTAVTQGTTYCYQVRATNYSGDTAPSNQATVNLPSTTAPAAPTGLIGTLVSNARVDLRWTDNASNEEGFILKRCDPTCTEINRPAPNTTTYSDNFSFVDGVTYFYSVLAFNGAGNSATSDWSFTFILPPAAPSNLTATSISLSQINLAWQDNSTNETSFKIERATGSCTATFSEIVTTGANAVTYQNYGLTANTTYCYRIRAVNSAGYSAYSNTASATTSDGKPSAPTNLSAGTVSVSEIDINWQDNSNNETSFKIERATGSCTATFSQIATTGANITVYKNTGLSSGMTYCYRVRASNASGDSSYSNTASAVTGSVPAAPSSLAASVISQSQIDLSWTDNSNNETGFEIERSTGTCTAFSVIGTTGANVTTYQNTGLLANTTYCYRVNAVNTYGDSSYSNTISAVTGDTQAPTAPSNLSGSAASSTQINLTWTASSDNIGVTGYYIYRNATLVSSTAGLSYSDTGLTPSTAYQYFVKAFDASGNISPQSNTITVTTQSAPVDNPPTVSITSPANGNTVSGTVSVTASATDDKGISKVDFYIDGALKSSDASTPYSYSWNTTSYVNGGHTIMVRAYDTINQYKDAQISVTVNNVPPPTQVTISSVSVTKTSTTATIKWTTNVAASSQVCYGLTAVYGTCTPLDTNLVTSHTVTIIGLSSSQRYYYQAISTAGGVTGRYSGNFRTARAEKTSSRGTK